MEKSTKEHPRRHTYKFKVFAMFLRIKERVASEREREIVTYQE